MSAMTCRIASLAALLLTSIVAFADQTVNNEAEIRIQLDVKQEYATDLCQAKLEVEWYQKGPTVHVESVLTNADCDASSGFHTLRVSYRDATGETKSVEFPETWERADAAPVRAENDYYIAENIDVLRVRPGKLRCVCSDAGDSEQ